MGTSAKVIAGALRSVAEQQSGFFTASQAMEAGYADSVHKYHVDNGDWVKEYRGIYRLADVDRPAWGDLVVWSMWSRDRDDEPQGVYARETALAVHGVIEMDMEVLHMTVPSKFRKNCEIPPKLELHKEDLFPRDIERRDGFLVTSLEKAIEDVKAFCTNPKIISAVRQAGSFVGIGTATGGVAGASYPAEKAGSWDEESWTGAIQLSGWGGGMSFEEALNAGQD